MDDTTVTSTENDLTPIPPSLVARRCSVVLTWGFRISAALLLAGIARAVVDQRPLDSRLATPEEFVAGMRTVAPGSLITLGIIAMILTPLVSSFTIALTFFQQHDARYGRLTLLVLLILGLSLSLSLR